MKAAEKAFSNEFQIGKKSVNDSLMNDKIYFVKKSLKEMAQRRALGDMFERDLEKLSKSTRLMDDFTTRNWTSFCLYAQAQNKFASYKRKNNSGDSIGNKNELLHPFTTDFSFCVGFGGGLRSS